MKTEFKLQSQLALKKKLCAYSVELQQINQDNMLLLLDWRNQADIRLQMVNQNLITLKQHIAWFEKISDALNQQHFVVYYKAQPIGSINLTTTEPCLSQAKCAEVGLYIAEPKYKGNLLAFAPSLAINDYAFKDLHVEQLVSKVRCSNQAAINYNQQLGYQFEPLDDTFTKINLNVEQYNQSTKQLKHWLSRG